MNTEEEKDTIKALYMLNELVNKGLSRDEIFYAGKNKTQPFLEALESWENHKNGILSKFDNK